MRIWAFPSFYPYNYPGLRWSGTFAHRQYQGLIANGAELKVIQPVLWYPPFPLSNMFKDWKKWQKFGYPSERVYDGIEVFHPRIPNMKPNSLFGKPYNDRFTDCVQHFFKSRNIRLDPKRDLVYSQWIPSAGIAQNAAHSLGLKSAVLGIGDDVIIIPKENEQQRSHLIKVLTEADGVFFCADYLGREAQVITGRKIPYTVSYFGVDYDTFYPYPAEKKTTLRKHYGVPDGKTAILNVASPLVRKGWLDLFDALVEIKKTQTDFVLLAGHAGWKDIDIQAEVAARGLQDHVIDLGEIKPETLSDLYNAADIFCLPSHWEGLATVIMESMACGLPVITTNVCGQPEIVTNGVTGILIPAKEVATLTNELSVLLSDAGKREKLGANARSFIVEKWGNAKDNSGKLLRHFEEILAL